jgi:carbonic anhydrase/acetyltransferase-like protein (isoleucine patch superfamily)
MIIELQGNKPQIDKSVFLADSATVIGRVSIGPESSIWFGSVLRGDIESITIGEATNIQDLTMMHADSGTPTRVGNRVTVGHRAILHGCVIEDEALVGMGAIVQNRAIVRTHSIIASGSVVREGFEVPANTLVAGVPAKVIRELTPAEIEYMGRLAAIYVERSKLYENKPQDLNSKS